MQTAPSPLESDIAAGTPSTRTNAPTKMNRGVRFRASKELGMDKSQAQSVPGAETRQAAPGHCFAGKVLRPSTLRRAAVVAPAGHVRCSTRQHE